MHERCITPMHNFALLPNRITHAICSLPSQVLQVHIPIEPSVRDDRPQVSRRHVQEPNHRAHAVSVHARPSLRDALSSYKASSAKHRRRADARAFRACTIAELEVSVLLYARRVIVHYCVLQEYHNVAVRQCCDHTLLLQHARTPLS